MIQKYFTPVVSLACLILAFCLLRSCHRNEENEQFESMYIAANDSLRNYIDENGLHIAEINVLHGSMDNLKNLIAGTDSTLRRLQMIVNKNTVSASILLSTTHNAGSSISTITAHDTVKKDSLIFIYPEYKTTWNEKWSKGTITANKDSIYRSFTTFNDLEIKQEWQKQKVKGHLFKQKTLVFSIKNQNPYTITTNAKSFSFEAPKKRKGLTFAMGALFGSLGTIYLSKKIK